MTSRAGAHVQRPRRYSDGRTRCSCGRVWPCPIATEPVVTTEMFTPAERAAWSVAVERGLSITAADLRAMLTASAVAEPQPDETGVRELDLAEERLDNRRRLDAAVAAARTAASEKDAWAKRPPPALPQQPDRAETPPVVLATFNPEAETTP